MDGQGASLLLLLAVTAVTAVAFSPPSPLGPLVYFDPRPTQKSTASGRVRRGWGCRRFPPALYPADAGGAECLYAGVPMNKEGIPPASAANRTVIILSRTDRFLVAEKPPSVVCHHSGWTGSRSRAKRGEEPEIPMLQRVRDGLGGKRRVNVVHRLDRGASGALLFAYADEDDEAQDLEDRIARGEIGEDQREEWGRGRSATALLAEALSSPESTKTYMALVRGEGILSGEDLRDRGWFAVDRPIKDEKGRLNNATTLFRFVAGQSEDSGTGAPRASIVLARPLTGRWHQVRRHLNGLSHPILGDSTHGASKTNREWKERRGMPGERTCLHLARLKIPPVQDVAPEGIDVSCPIGVDMVRLMEDQMPNVLREAEPILAAEGIILRAHPNDSGREVLQYSAPTIQPVDGERRRTVAKIDQEPIKLLSQGQHYVVASKPPTVVCHHSAWTGRRSEVRRLYEPTPMLQRVRNACGRRVNLVHRLDRGASGCLVFAFTDRNDDDSQLDGRATAALMGSMGSDAATKTYVAICRGDGRFNGENMTKKGWFTVDEHVKDENGKVIGDSLTDLRFLASDLCVPATGADGVEDIDPAGRHACIVLARPKTGRWHQIRQHLANSLGHPILGDSTHGLSRTNRIWRDRGMMKERVCLHLAHVELPPSEYSPQGISSICPIPNDMMDLIKSQMPNLLENTISLLLEEGCIIEGSD